MSQSPFHPLRVPEVSDPCTSASISIPESDAVRAVDIDHDLLVQELENRENETVHLRNKEPQSTQPKAKETEQLHLGKAEVAEGGKPEDEIQLEARKDIDPNREILEERTNAADEALKKPKASKIEEEEEKGEEEGEGEEEEEEEEREASSVGDGEKEVKPVQSPDHEVDEGADGAGWKATGLEEPIVIHNSSSWVVAGFVSDDLPSVYVSTSRELGQKYIYQYPLKYLNPDYRESSPAIREGVISDWEKMEEIWRSVFYSNLKIDPGEHPILLTEIPLNPKANRERMTEIMFEKFDISAMYISRGAELALIAAGRNTGTVLQSGDSLTLAISIYEGYCMPNTFVRTGIAGSDLTDYLAKMLMDRGYSCASDWDREYICHIKETLCYVAYDFDAEMGKAAKSNDLHKSYVLPDGREFVLQNEHFRCPEVLFKPSPARGDVELGIHEAIFQSIMKCNVDIWKDLYESIVIAGGTTMFDGIAERLEKEIKALAPSSVEVKVLANPERKYAIWLGGSILASEPQFPEVWISKEEYEESGPAVVHRKCF